MKNRNEEMRISVLGLAVQGALAVMFALPVAGHAADAAQTEAGVDRRPTNFIEIGAENVSTSSQKFGEYNGLNKSGGDLIGNFSVSGGDSYSGGDGTLRWNLNGHDLGTTSREVGATVGNQGRWSIGVNYDELRHNTAAGYQTPYQGSVGGNNFNLPADFSGTNATNTQTLSNAQKGDFQTMDIGSTRKNSSFNVGYNIDRQWDVKFEYNQLQQTGAKLMAFAADKFSGVGGATAESISILPNPTNYKTDTFNLALNWVGEKGHMTGSYYGSFFRDGYDRVTWQTYQGANAINTMTTMPGNDFNQLNLAGGYAFTSKTKLAGELSYGRNTQNDAFVDSKQMAAGLGHLPVASLGGEVINTHGDLKLTDQTIKNLDLSASIKYDKRDNRTQSYAYDFFSFSSNEAKYPNTPLSIKKTQFELAGDYRLDKAQHIRMAYNHDDTSRWCNNFAVIASSIINTNLNSYPSGTNCVVDTGTKEDKVGAGYRVKLSDDLNLNAGYSYGKRKSDFDLNAITAMIGVNGNDPTLAAALKIRGLNAGDYPGFHPYFDEDRKQQMFKAGANWQANDRLTLGINGKYTDDKYDTTYGWKDGNTWSLNLDASYSYSDKGLVSTYVTQQHRERNRTDLRTATTTTASSTNSINIPAYATDNGMLKDDDLTIGLTLKQGGLMSGKLELSGDLSYSMAKTGYSTTLNWNGVTLGGQTCSDPSILSCGALPDIKNTTTRLKLSGNYQVDKSAKVVVTYLYSHLASTDYYYNALQYGYTPTTLLPTNQTTGSYNVNVVAISYQYNFK